LTYCSLEGDYIHNKSEIEDNNYVTNGMLIGLSGR